MRRLLQWTLVGLCLLVLALTGPTLQGQPSQGGRLQTILLNTVTTGTSIPINVTGMTNLTLYTSSTGTVSGGTLLFEEAYYNEQTQPIYSLTWSQIKSLGSPTDFGTNSQTAYHATTAAYSHVRARISSAITGGGTITVYLVAQ